ncbi:hypothetical protein T12_11653 [Trichinella patagoniensis]|uniref:Uncharacterized protein n=1 Tax=Trichinella patagoniensis TaxID=990121 RepID=A0A0V0ZM67_9BILA|nr:hypothetical protein T12_11653 [Trichinella patagoniensis]
MENCFGTQKRQKCKKKPQTNKECMYDEENYQTKAHDEKKRKNRILNQSPGSPEVWRVGIELSLVFVISRRDRGRWCCCRRRRKQHGCGLISQSFFEHSAEVCHQAGCQQWTGIGFGNVCQEQGRVVGAGRVAVDETFGFFSTADQYALLQQLDSHFQYIRLFHFALSGGILVRLRVRRHQDTFQFSETMVDTRAASFFHQRLFQLAVHATCGDRRCEYNWQKGHVGTRSTARIIFYGLAHSLTDTNSTALFQQFSASSDHWLANWRRRSHGQLHNED